MSDSNIPPPNKTSKSEHAQRSGSNKAPPKNTPPISKARKRVSSLIALIVAICFAGVALLIVETRQKSFYGEPLFEKMAQILEIKLNGLPDDPDKRAQAITGIPTLLLLPPEAVLPQAPAERFKRIGTQFGFVTKDTQLGTKFVCAKSDIRRIPNIALNIAIGLESFPEDLLQRVKMEYIVFCGDLKTAYGSVAGFPAPPNNSMLLNLTNRHNGHEIRDLFFHEFYHLLEDRVGLVKDPVWLSRFNTGYKNDYEGMMGPANNRFGSGGFGFLNNYSRSHPHEDRAEIFAALMTAKRPFVYYVLKNKDDMLAAKTEYVAATAQTHLGLSFEPLWSLKNQ